MVNWQKGSALPLVRENPRALKMRGDSLKDCVHELREAYGENYLIIKSSAELHENFFARLAGKKQYVVEYQAYPPRVRAQTAPLSFEDEKQKILNIAPKTSIAPHIADLIQQQKTISEKIESIETHIHAISYDSQVHPAIKKVEEILEENEFSFSFIKRTAEKLKKCLTLDELVDETHVHRTVMQWLVDEIKIKPSPPYANPPRIIALVGPTGVGKTTTIAKLAAKYRFQENTYGYEPLVRLVTIDLFRIAARQQIEKYAEHMEIKTSVAESADDIARIMKMDEGRLDVMLIDTIGYSPNDYEGIAKMRKILDVHGVKTEIYLAISATTKTSDVQNILRNYEPFNYCSLIITKCDETAYVGNIVSALAEKNKTVTYITNGQGVPKHLEEASPSFFLKKLTGFSVDVSFVESLFLQNTFAETAIQTIGSSK